MIRDIKELPVLPQTACRLLLAIDQDALLKEIEEIILQDQALATKVLQIANSPFYAGILPIKDVRTAILRIGFVELKNLIVTMCLKHTLDPYLTDIDMTGFWLHAIACAHSAQFLSRMAGNSDSGFFYTAGLIHDIGRLALLVLAPDMFDQLLKVAQEKNKTFREAELELGIDHAELGAKVLEYWNFPKDLVMTVRQHHNPADSEDKRALTVFKADIVARAVDFVPEPHNPPFPELPKGLTLNRKELLQAVKFLRRIKDDLRSTWESIF